MKIVDLSYSLNNKMLTFSAPWHPKVSFEKVGQISEVGRNTMCFKMGSHTATHVDAPLHFLSDSAAIDKVDLSVFFGKVTIVDLSDLADDSILSREMLESYSYEKRVIFRFNQSQHWGTERFYSDYPYFSSEAIDFLISKGVVLVGMDTCSPDNPKAKLGSTTDSPMHKRFLNAGIVLLEYLNIPELDDLSGWCLSAVPLKIEGADGCPVRAFIFKGDF